MQSDDVTAQSVADWRENGYVVVRRLIEPGILDMLVESFQRDALSDAIPLLRQPSFRRETGQYSYPHEFMSKHELSEHGFMLQGIKNPHALHHLPAFAGLVLRCLCGSEMEAAIRAICAVDDDPRPLVLWQSMFFDANPSTDPHFDAYYIDSEPRGGLIGVWLALEDIQKDAGRFYVYRGSYRWPEPEVSFELSNSEYLAQVAGRVADRADARVAPEMRKGDVLIWNGRTIHGALPWKDQTKSRKSLTGHITLPGLIGRNPRRVYHTSVLRRCGAFLYSMSNNTSETDYAFAAEARRRVEIDGRVLEFSMVRTANGEQAVSAKKLTE